MEGGFPVSQPEVNANGLLLLFKDQWKQLSHEDLEPPPEHVPPPPRPPKRIPEPHNGKCKEFFSNHQWVKDETEEDKDGPIKEETRAPLSIPCGMNRSQDTEIRSRTAGGGLRNTQAAFPAQGQAPPPKEAEEQEHAPPPWKPFLVHVCVAAVLTAGAYLCYRVCFH